MSPRTFAVGFSPCPNDTFMFHALVHGIVRAPGIGVVPQLSDIEELNRRAESEAPLPFTKLSIGALAAVADRYSALSAGAALGRGVGPLVLARTESDAPRELSDLRGCRVAIPGARTTARLLVRMFGPSGMSLEVMRFDRIVGAIASGEVDAGVIIHESRFTFAEHGLREIADLGACWERETELPLPLGVIAASRGLSAGLVSAVENAIRASVAHAFADPRASRDYVRAHSQEIGDEVCERHIELYVNRYSLDIGADGRRAVEEMLARGRQLGLLEGVASPWR